jgi:hypothetical protein
MNKKDNNRREYTVEEQESKFFTDRYSIFQGALIHTCGESKRYDPVSERHVYAVIPFSDESKGIITHCPTCCKQLDWDTAAEHRS